MATITSEGGQLKVEQGSNISYYPLDDVSLTIITAKLRILVRQKEMHAFTYADITAPAGADLETKADAIAALLGSHSIGGGGGGDASAANQTTMINTLADIYSDTTSIDGNITKCDTDNVAGTVTANAGTNLNTSALAVESGGNLDTIAGDTTSLDSKVTACDTGNVSGTVTANAGTNLNTSALATESGGNLDAIATNTTKGNLTKLLTEANDLVHTYTWLDGGAADQRISTIVYSSSALSLSVTETFTYSGGAGTYHVATSTLS